MTLAMADCFTRPKRYFANTVLAIRQIADTALDQTRHFANTSLFQIDGFGQVAQRVS